MEIQKWAEIVNKANDDEEKLSKQIFIEGEYIVLNVNYDYNIALSRCNTAEKILAWICHLSEKNWITPVIIKRFVELSCSANKVKMVWA